MLSRPLSSIKSLATITFWLLLALVAWHPAEAFHIPAQKLDNRFTKVSFNEPLRYQLTETNVTWQDIDADPELHHSWVSNRRQNPSFRMENQALWLTSAIKNATQDPMTVIIDFDYALADEVDFYAIDNSNDRPIKQVETGTDYDFSRRELPYRTFAFELTLQPDQEVNLYLRIVDSASIFATWNLWNKEVFVAKKLTDSIFEGLLLGLLIVFATISLLTYAGLREKQHLFFGSFIATFTLLVAILNGSAYKYLWPTSPEVNQSSVYVCAGLVLLFLSLFSKQSHKHEDKSKTVEYLQFLATLLSITVIFQPLIAPIKLHLPITVGATIGVILIGSGCAYWRLYKRGLQAGSHAVIWTIFLCGGLLLTLSRYDILAGLSFGEKEAAAAMALACAIFSFTLVRRIKVEKEEKEQAKSRAAETLQQYFDIYQNAVEGLFTVSKSGRLISANPQLISMLGYQNLADLRRAVASEGPGKVIGDVDMAKQLLNEVIQKGALMSREIQGLKKDGAHLWGLMSMRMSNAAGDDQEEYIQGAVVDITEKHQAYQKLAYMATHDSLTGVLNRAEFEKKLYSALTDLKQDNLPSTMLYLDLERFKLINDSSGHMAGDSLLRQISDQLKSVLKGQGVLARLGGDEFAILLNGINGNEAFVIAYRIVETVKEFRFLWEEQIYTIGVSIGMKELSIEDSSLNQIFTSADAACYVAKEKGRNRIHIYCDEDIDVKHHQSQMEWISILNNALDNDKFILYYQLIVPLKSQPEPLHYEILLRMRDDENNIVPPDTFIPAAERYNLMTSIDRWVLRAYFRWLSQNREHMQALHLCSINLSGSSIADPAFREVVEQLFVEFMIPHNKICFEITESIAIINLNATQDFINQFKQLGCQFSLDDFGTGFSSYGYLKNLAVDQIKIDGSFVKDLKVDPIDRAMVNSINEVAKAIGMDTVAEFVESDAILDELRDIGVDYAQGFSIHRPSPLSQLVNNS